MAKARVIQVLAAASIDALDERGYDVDSFHCDTLKEAKELAKYYISDEYANVSESDPLGYSRVVVDGMCVADYFRPTLKGVKAAKSRTVVVDPQDFTEGQWEELWNASELVKATEEARWNAQPVKRYRKQVAEAARVLDRRAIEILDLYDDVEWANDLAAGAETLRGLIAEVK